VETKKLSAMILKDLKISASQWAQHIKCIVSTTAATVGDALRRVGDEGVIETDFVLLHADVVGNINLGRVLHQHRLRKEADPTVLMTSIYKRATPTHASRSLEDDTVLGLSSENEVCSLTIQFCFFTSVLFCIFRFFFGKTLLILRA
jgi:NDP-sugar pyrophosphorylase family protein